MYDSFEKDLIDKFAINNHVSNVWRAIEHRLVANEWWHWSTHENEAANSSNWM